MKHLIENELKVNTSLDGKKLSCWELARLAKVLDYINEFDTEVLIIDIDKPGNIKEDNQFEHFDCTKLDKIASTFENVILEFKVTDLLYSSYPKNSDGLIIDFDNQNSLDTIENINFHSVRILFYQNHL